MVWTRLCGASDLFPLARSLVNDEQSTDLGAVRAPTSADLRSELSGGLVEDLTTGLLASSQRAICCFFVF